MLLAILGAYLFAWYLFAIIKIEEEFLAAATTYKVVTKTPTRRLLAVLFMPVLVYGYCTMALVRYLLYHMPTRLYKWVING